VVIKDSAEDKVTEVASQDSATKDSMDAVFVTDKMNAMVCADATGSAPEAVIRVMIASADAVVVTVVEISAAATEMDAEDTMDVVTVAEKWVEGMETAEDMANVMLDAVITGMALITTTTDGLPRRMDTAGTEPGAMNITVTTGQTTLRIGPPRTSVVSDTSSTPMAGICSGIRP
jgi:hypothetical protein